MRGAARENGVLCLKDTALGAASVLEGLLANIALCPTTPEIRWLFTADTWSSGQTSYAQGNAIALGWLATTPTLTPPMRANPTTRFWANFSCTGKCYLV